MVTPVDPKLATLLELGHSTRARRHLAAYALALPADLRPTSRALGIFLGVSESCIRMDWARADVGEMARGATAAGLSALMLACARSFLVALCARADAGDLDAGRELRAWLVELGALSRVLVPEPGDDAGTGHAGGALATEDAARALADTLARIAAREA